MRWEVSLLKLKKILVRCYAIGLLLMYLGTAFDPVYAAEEAIYIKDGGAVIYAQETEWRYRVLDGKLQKRLWSITYGKWLTDWEWV